MKPFAFMTKRELKAEIQRLTENGEGLREKLSAISKKSLPLDEDTLFRLQQINNPKCS